MSRLGPEFQLLARLSGLSERSCQYLSVLSIRMWRRRRVMPDVFCRRTFQPLDMSARRERHERSFPEPYATEYGGGPGPLLGEFFQFSFNGGDFLIGKCTAKADHDRMRDGVGDAVDGRGSGQALRELLCVIASEVTDDGECAADFIGGSHNASCERATALSDASRYRRYPIDHTCHVMYQMSICQ